MKRTFLIVIITLLIGQVACSRKQRTSEPVKANDSAGAATSTTEGARSEARSFLEKGREFYRNDEDVRAAEAFEQAIKLDPGLAEAHFRLALANDILGNEKEAAEGYKNAVEAYKKYFANPEHSKDDEAHYNLGQTYAGLHLYSEAVKEYRLAIGVKDDDPAIYYDLGRALMKMAQYDEAAEAFAKSLNLDPDNYRAEDELSEAREGIKRIKVGRKHQEELLKKKKDENVNAQDEGTPTPQNPQKPVSQKPSRTEHKGE
jgi:tetratricopeptide (TPR) repeat protein